MSVTQQGTLIATALFPLLLFCFPFFGLFIFIYMVPFLSFMLLIHLKNTQNQTHRSGFRFEFLIGL